MLPEDCMTQLPVASELDLPPALQTSLARHRENLSSMMTSLQAVGLSEEAIDAHLSTLIGSYQAELSTALTSLRSPA